MKLFRRAGGETEIVEDGLRDMEDRIRSNMHEIRNRKETAEVVFEEIKDENFLEFIKDNKKFNKSQAE